VSAPVPHSAPHEPHAQAAAPGHEGEASEHTVVGPVDWPNWAAGLLGLLAGLAVVAGLVLANGGL
jgi:hypothetical protein